jgi:hypothetical protein
VSECRLNLFFWPFGALAGDFAGFDAIEKAGFDPQPSPGRANQTVKNQRA